MSLIQKRWTVQYGEARLGDTKGYAVVSPDGTTRLGFGSKSDAAAERDRRNAALEETA